MPKQLIAGYSRFREGYFQENEESLLQLAEGQSPRVAVVCCCDSRVDPTIIFDAQPGELFVIRNVANLVPEHENDGRPRGTSSALEFAVTGLKVSHIVVLGHAQCGGIKALVDHNERNPKKFVDQWMSIAEKVKQDILSKDLPADEKYTQCEKSAIEHSLGNLMGYPWIKERVDQGDLQLHGWYYDLSEGILQCFDPEQGEFVQA